MFSNVAVGAITSIILCFPMIALHRLNKKNEVKLNKASVVICFLLAFLWLMAESFKPGNAALFSYISGKTVLFSVVYTIGAFHLLTEFAKIFHSMLHASFSSTSKLSEIISGLSAKKIFILLCIFYIPHILMSFPGMLCVDSDHHRGNPGFPASTRESPRETFFNTSRGQIPNHGSGAMTRSPSPLAWRPDFPGAPREAH